MSGAPAGPVMTGAMLSSIQHGGPGSFTPNGGFQIIYGKPAFPVTVQFSIQGGLLNASGFDLGKMSPKAFSMDNHIGVAPSLGLGQDGKGLGAGFNASGEGGAGGGHSAGGHHEPHGMAM